MPYSPTSLAQPLPSADDTPETLVDLAREFSRRIEPHFLSDAEAAYLRIPDGEPIVFETKIGRYTLDSPLTGVKQGRSIYIPLSELFRTVYLAVQVNSTADQVSGWAFSEDREVSFDTQTGEARFGERTLTIPSNAYYSDGIDIYMQAEALKDWLDFEFSPNLRFLTIELSTPDTLPIIAQLQRRNQSVGGFGGRTLDVEHEDATEPYSWISTPIFDLRASQALRNLPGDNFQKNLSYSLIANADLLKHSAAIYVGGNENNSLQSARITFSRQSSENNLLGPLRATHYQWGDIQAVTLPYQATSGLQRGIRISNQSLTGRSDYGFTQFSGDIQQGWDVELYRNNVLIAKQDASDEGRYNFEDVTLFAGNNNFKLVFYGPQGQTREETQNIPIDVNSQSGFRYDVSLTEQGRPVIDLSNRTPSRSGLLFAGSVSMGLGGLSALTLGLDTPIYDDGHRVQGIASLSSFWRKNALSATTRIDQSGGFIGQLGLSREVLNQQANVNYSIQSNFPSVSSDATTSSQSYGFALAGRFPEHFGEAPAYQLNFTHAVSDNAQQNQANFSVARNILGGSSTLGLQWKEGDNIRPLFTGDASWGITLDKFSVRARANYDFENGALETVDVSTRYRLNNDFSIQNSANYNFLSKDTVLTARANWDTGLLTLSPRLQWATTGQWSAFIDGRLSLGWDQQDRYAHISSDRTGAYGALSVRVFHDLNGDGLFNGGDQALESVRVEALQARRTGLTNARGIAYIPRLPTLRATDIQIDQSSLEDSFLTPLNPGVSIIPRAGRTQTLDIPLVGSSEVEGTIMLRGANGDRPLSGVTIKAYDLTGRLWSEGRADADGFYILSHLPPGFYRLEISPDVLRNNDLRLRQSSFVRIANSHEVKVVNFDALHQNLRVNTEQDYSFERPTRETMHTGLTPQMLSDGFGINLGQYRTPFGRNSAFLLLIARFPELLAGKHLVEKPGTSITTYELEIGPFESADSATQACQTLQVIHPACAVTTLNSSIQSMR